MAPLLGGIGFSRTALFSTFYFRCRPFPSLFSAKTSSSLILSRSVHQKNDSRISSSSFSLFAPTIAEVNLIGSFSGWHAIPMQKQVNTGTFQLSSSSQLQLPDGEHEYKFRIKKTFEQKQWIDVIDPYVQKYDPKRKTGLIDIRNGQKYTEEYRWKYDYIKLPENHELVIYELYVADYSDNGQFSGIIPKLDHLSELGINAIELMPFQECMGNDHEWGYAPRHHFALKTSYGTANDLKKLVDECHRRRIRVFFDGVFNHSSSDCPLAIIDKNYWYYKDKHHPDEPYYWGPEFNYEYYDEKLNIKPASKFAHDIIRYWIGEFHLDGIRFDAAKQIANYDILRELDIVARSVRLNQPFYTQAEYVPEKSDIIKANKGPLDACWSSTFHGVVCEALVNQDKFELDLLKYIISTPDLVNYLTCHDNERLMFLINQRGKPVDDNDAFQRMRLGVILLTTSVGVPLIWQGDEFGEGRELGTDDHYRKTFLMQWSLMKNERNKNLYYTYKNLLELRQTIFNKDELYQVTFIDDNCPDRILVYARSNQNDDNIVVIANFADKKKNGYEVKNFPQDGQWIDWLTNTIYSVTESKLKLDLKPFDGKVLVRQK